MFTAQLSELINITIAIYAGTVRGFAWKELEVSKK